MENNNNNNISNKDINIPFLNTYFNDNINEQKNNNSFLNRYTIYPQRRSINPIDRGDQNNYLNKINILTDKEREELSKERISYFLSKKKRKKLNNCNY